MSSALDQCMFEFKKIISPLRCAFFTSTSDLLGMHCFHSTLSLYQSDRYYSIYDIPALQRVLLKKEESINFDVEKFLHQNQEHIICRIVEWTPYAKSFLLIDIGDDVVFDESAFFDLMQNVEWLQKSFDSLYIAQRSSI